MSSDRLLCGMLGSQLGMQPLRGDWILRVDPLRDSHYGDSTGRRGLVGGGAHWGHPLWAILSWALPFSFLPFLSLLFLTHPRLFFSSLSCRPSSSSPLFLFSHPHLPGCCKARSLCHTLLLGNGCSTSLGPKAVEPADLAPKLGKL